MKKDIVIYGAGGLGREILCLIIKKLDEWNPIGFVDDGVPEGKIINGIPVLPKLFLYQKHQKKLAVAIGIADPTMKMNIFAELKKITDIYFPTLIAPTAIVDESAELEEGCIISNFCLISIDVKLGQCVFLNTGSFIGHDASLGSFVTLMPTTSISGGVVINEKVLVGAQSFVLQGKSIGKNSVISAGSKVFSNVPDNVTVFGNPAYILNKK